MRFERRYTQGVNSPYAKMAFRATDSEIRNPDGSLVFQARDFDVPQHWSQVAADVLVPMAEKARALSRPRAAARVADEIERLVRKEVL